MMSASNTVLAESGAGLDYSGIEEAKHALSIQSHVVHGYVGNKAAVFPLQMLNWDVDILNTVNFSNHTGYGSLEGSCSTGKELLEIYSGLKKIDVSYDAVLTGYVHGYQTLESVGEICIDVKKRNENNGKQTIWLLDPVMGDEGVLYVEETVIPVYRKILESQMVDVITPNQYELEVLLEHKITCTRTLKKALGIFHEKYGVKHIVLSSLFADSFDDLEGGPETLYCCVSSTTLKDQLVLFKIDKISGYFTGVGDMFSSLLLDRICKSDDIVKNVNEVLTIMRKILLITKMFATSTGKIGDTNMKGCELRVVESKNVYSEHQPLYTPIFISK